MPPPKVTAVVPVIMQSRHGTACQQHRKSASRVAERGCPIAKLSPVARPYCRKYHLGGKTNRVGAGPTRLYQPAVATYRKPCL
jgi:hypothetical protein